MYKEVDGFHKTVTNILAVSEYPKGVHITFNDGEVIILGFEEYFTSSTKTVEKDGKVLVLSMDENGLIGEIIKYISSVMKDFVF